MKIFADNKEVNIPPQWNLLTGTSNTKTITIPKGNHYPGNYEYILDPGSPIVYSAYIINKSSVDIAFHIDNGSNPSTSNVIKANSSGKIIAKASDTSGGFFTTADGSLATSDCTFQVKEEKLELGNTATPWMPAIADLMLKNQNGGESSNQLTHS